MITAQIHNRYPTLTEMEQKIADFILASPQKVLRMTVTELAAECGTAPSAVTRFCKSVKTEGFSELKILLAKESASKEDFSPVELPAFSPDDSTEIVFQKVFSSGVNTLRDTLQMLDFNKIRQIVSVFSGARKICFFGVGTSSVIATDAQYRFSQTGIEATACTDILFMNVCAASLAPGDVAVGISHSGATHATVDCLRRAKASGAATVAITSFTDSPLYRECDHSISVFADEKNYPVEAVSARVAHICLIDAFMMTLATMNYAGFCEHIEKRNQILKEIRYKP